MTARKRVQTSSASSDGIPFKGLIRRVLVAREVEKVQAWLANWLTALRRIGTINF
jgi:hypothetical protein